jgi:hypothetical protein
MVDPLLGALALDIPEASMQAFLGGDILHSAAVTAFRAAKIKENELKKFQDFLRNFGCVDLFGIYSTKSAENVITLSTPFLSAMLHKLVQHGEVISTDKGTESALTESGGVSQLPTLSSYLSAYVPHPALQVLDVSAEAYRSLIELFGLVEREVKTMKLSPTSPPSWLVALTQKPWCPCVNTDLAQDRCNQGLSFQYLVTSPLNIQPHSHCHTGLAIHPDIKSAGLFVKDPGSSGGEFVHYSSLLAWMSRQDRVLASISIMTRMYKLLCSVTEADVSPLEIIRSMLRGGKKFLWIFDQVSNSKPFSTTSLVWGALVPLSTVVLADSSGLLPPSGPVKTLYPHYDPELVRLIFTRSIKSSGQERICPVCQAIEGMFGVRGQHWPGSARGNHVCGCKDTGFGR